MIPITYIRSSLFSQINFCEHQYFLNYVLGLSESSNHKAELGTCTHKILEILAKIKLDLQSRPTTCYTDPYYEIDIPYITKLDLTKEDILPDLEVDRINSTRIAKDRYKWDCFIKYGHKRYGKDLVEYLIKKVFERCSKDSKHDWKRVHLSDVSNYVWIALDYKGGIFDPRKRDIVAPETYFDFEVTEPWGKYNYELNGTVVSGNLKLRGTIDLVTKLDEDTYEIVDWKTGQRLDWATGETKTYEKLQRDMQLLYYYYAAKRLWPNKNILVSIFFIRDGGPYTPPFDDSSLDTTQRSISRLFNYIQNIKVPKLLDPKQKDFRCTKICEHYKSQIGSHNTCQFIYNHIKQYGLDQTIKSYTKEGHSSHEYEAPGDI